LNIDTGDLKYITRLYFTQMITLNSVNFNDLALSQQIAILTINEEIIKIKFKLAGRKVG
jgi:hypothetical protein